MVTLYVSLRRSYTAVSPTFIVCLTHMWNKGNFVFAELTLTARMT
jgi:hypothetical protein